MISTVPGFLPSQLSPTLRLIVSYRYKSHLRVNHSEVYIKYYVYGTKTGYMVCHTYMSLDYGSVYDVIARTPDKRLKTKKSVGRRQKKEEMVRKGTTRKRRTE